jgi:hypothetical protein
MSKGIPTSCAGPWIMSFATVSSSHHLMGLSKSRAFETTQQRL